RVAFDIENADFVLSFGSGLIDGWGSPVRMIRANSALKDAGATLVQVEPRLSNSAARADQWVPANPGTEADLALGIAAVIISNKLHDRGLFSSGASSLGDFKNELLAKYTPKAVSGITGIDENTIITLAGSFAKAKNPVAICGRGKGLVPGSMREVAAVNVLNALKSAVNEKGGVWIVNDPDYISWEEALTDPIASKALAQPRIDGAGQGRFANTKHMAGRMITAINEGGPVKALLVANANPMYALPDTKAVKKAFDQVGFVASFSSFMDETAANADLVLPNHIYLERFEDIPAGSGVSKPMIGLSKPVVSPQFNTKHLGETIILTAKALGGTIAASFPWDDYETCLEETLGDKWDTLMENGVWIDEAYNPGSTFGGSGKFKFAGLSDEPVQAAGDVNSFPLVLIPYDTIRLSSGYYGDSPFMIKTVSDTILKGKDAMVEVNPDTARAAGLSEGASAMLKTPVGQAAVKVHLFDGIKPGVVAMPRGLGHTAYDKYLAGKGVNVNDLIGPVADPATGHDAAWGIRAKLVKA
ncbi:MAG: molybdopterin-dependent oxidoreductase, partial [Desulfobacterales bacterium]|nr:molybdopterin-dependent oxidoreductase [Desulfobacterales bacterium]